MTTTYIVVRDCHRGPGRCVECHGTPHVVEQARSTDKAWAEAVVQNWRSYNAALITRKGES